MGLEKYETVLFESLVNGVERIRRFHNQRPLLFTHLTIRI